MAEENSTRKILSRWQRKTPEQKENEYQRFGQRLKNSPALRERNRRHHRASYQRKKTELQAKHREYYQRKKTDIQQKHREYYQKNKNKIADKAVRRRTQRTLEEKAALREYNRNWKRLWRARINDVQPAALMKILVGVLGCTPSRKLCVICGRPVVNRREKAKTCSLECGKKRQTTQDNIRKREKRQKERSFQGE